MGDSVQSYTEMFRGTARSQRSNASAPEGRSRGVNGKSLRGGVVRVPVPVPVVVAIAFVLILNR